ncbi:hypothetical protein BMETH_1165_2 [methanotrophic bacterial endosymbiont of Bathymodiolus sp.]|nr:hypothetical protein BMETH_1165_2 [methanotrophic bacterial endosymbiont of Bathymodiolus sp.]
MFSLASPESKKARVQRRTRYPEHLHPVLTGSHRLAYVVHARLVQYGQHRRYLIHHTKQGYGVPTRSAVKYTNPEYYSSSHNRYFSSYY